MKTVLTLAMTPALLLIVFGLCLAIGPTRPVALEHIAERFDGVNWSSLPMLETVQARDGEALAYRKYGNGDDVILALHGSGGAGSALHPLAEALLGIGKTVIVPDIRGHGATGRRGDVDYVSQVMDDLDDLLAQVAPDTPDAKITLVGFSMGGGLALKYAAARAEKTGDVILLSPYLGYDAPPVTVENPHAPTTQWAAPSVPRIVALGMLNQIGVTALNHLPVVALATRKEDADQVVQAYTFRALQAVNPADWQANLAAIAPRTTVFVGERDELHAATGFTDALIATPAATLITLPRVDHMGLTLDTDAIMAVTRFIGESK
jgi:alpha-beta hydrolase superfamily lysophospholipase